MQLRYLSMICVGTFSVRFEWAYTVTRHINYHAVIEISYPNLFIRIAAYPAILRHVSVI